MVYTVYTISHEEAECMATKAMNFKLSEADIADLRRVADVYHMTMTDIIKEAIHEYVKQAQKDPYYRLTVNIEEASPQESAEILDHLERLTDEDLKLGGGGSRVERARRQDDQDPVYGSSGTFL